MSRSKLQDFEIISKLGSGSFGTVYKIKRIVDQNYYVIKNVRISELSYKEQQDAINEVQILSQLDSIYVVKYYDSFIQKDSLHIVMEYCDRGDLQNLIKKAKEQNVYGLNEDAIWSFGLQIILGLLYLHKKKILHRDLKTANVFLTKGNKKVYSVKIGDLGVAKLMDTSTMFANTVVGTPYYLSPELCENKPYRDKSDCWALGVILYECCTLKHPFDARNQCALILKITQAQVKPPSSSHTSVELINLVMWLLQKDPNNRPSMKDILNEELIRKKLIENKLELPEELLGDKITNNLKIIRPSKSSKKDTKPVNKTSQNVNEMEGNQNIPTRNVMINNEKDRVNSTDSESGPRGVIISPKAGKTNASHHGPPPPNPPSTNNTPQLTRNKSALGIAANQNIQPLSDQLSIAGMGVGVGIIDINAPNHSYQVPQGGNRNSGLAPMTRNGSRIVTGSTSASKTNNINGPTSNFNSHVSLAIVGEGSNGTGSNNLNNLPPSGTGGIPPPGNVPVKLVHGNRVRGGLNANKQRIVSEKVRMRHQIRTPATSTTQSRSQSEEKSERRYNSINSEKFGEEYLEDELDIDDLYYSNMNGVDDFDDNENGFEKGLSLPDNKVGWDGFGQDRKQYDDKMTRQQSLKVEKKELQQRRVSGSYEDDEFEVFEDDTMPVHYNGEGGNIDNDEGWNPVWTSRRGLIQPQVNGTSNDSKAEVDVSYHEEEGMASAMRNDFDENQSVDMTVNRRSESDYRTDDEEDDDVDIEALLEVIDETKKRAISNLGIDLFDKIYKLCTRYMNDVTADNVEGDNKFNGQMDLYKELEEALKFHHNESACEAVFGIKVLLALESKCDKVLSSKYETKTKRK